MAGVFTTKWSRRILKFSDLIGATCEVYIQYPKKRHEKKQPAPKLLVTLKVIEAEKGGMEGALDGVEDMVPEAALAQVGGDVSKLKSALADTRQAYTKFELTPFAGQHEVDMSKLAVLDWRITHPAIKDQFTNAHNKAYGELLDYLKRLD